MTRKRIPNRSYELDRRKRNEREGKGRRIKEAKDVKEDDSDNKLVGTELRSFSTFCSSLQDLFKRDLLTDVLFQVCHVHTMRSGASFKRSLCRMAERIRR